MKSSAVAALWVFVIGLVLLSNLRVAEATTPLPDRNLPLLGLSFELQSPEQIAKFMWSHFVFEADQSLFGKSDHWQKPEEFLERGKGDCEDFAIFAKSLLQRIGISSFLLNIYSSGSGHTVCVFQVDGKYNVLDGSNIIYTQSSDLKKVLSEINPFWESGAIVVPASNGDGGRILTEIVR